MKRVMQAGMNAGRKIIVLLILLPVFLSKQCVQAQNQSAPLRQRISINEGWKFFKYEKTSDADDLIYDVRPEINDTRDDKAADSRPTDAVQTAAKRNVLKPWILPTGNSFIKDPARNYKRPEGDPGHDFAFVRADFDDGDWESVNLPHDWAIKGPFFEGWQAEVGGGMGRLPSHGVAWYRKKLDIHTRDAGKSVFLDIDGAMAYAMVWINGHLAGGWPYGYASWRVDLTPYIKPGGVNQLAIRLDNPAHSSRWYPGGGIYRNVWLTKTSSLHVGQWGTYVTSREVTEAGANVDIVVNVDNDSDHTIKATSVVITKPALWGPPPTQKPNLYEMVVTVKQGEYVTDEYATTFGIRALRFDADKGIFVNGERVFLKGVNQHHDLGALGAAFNARAAERQLELLRDMGCNAIRMAHNPPAPELLELTDRMGFLVVDEIFDGWKQKKTPYDFHLIFPDWYEQDIRAFVRRDRNHPSVIMWSFGNEVGEQYTGEEGATLARKLITIVHEEDTTRPGTVSMNYAKPHMPLPAAVDLLSLNYQGEGIRDAPEYAGLEGIRTSPLYPAFRSQFPDKVIVSSENAAAVSIRGEYLFPVIDGVSAPVKDGAGGDSKNMYVSSYELYTVPFGSSADKVFSSIDHHPFVAGGFVWSGWDYLGEPTPYYLARSSYYGVIDLAGFPKDRFYLYQSRWRPELPMAHILPHWNWPDRAGQITPVHVFTSGDEAELFLNGKSLGRKKKQAFEYRLRWDDVVYQPGVLKVVAYKNGKEWAVAEVRTTGEPVQLEAAADRATIKADGTDLTFITVRITDKDGLTVPTARNEIKFNVEGPGEIVATDNGDPRDLTIFPSHTRNAFNGLCLVIVRGTKATGSIKLTASSGTLKPVVVTVKTIRQ